MQRFLECCGPRAARLWIWLHTSTPADWALALVGLGGVIAAVCTLRAITREVSATEKAANAAAAAVVEAQRSATIADRSAVAAADSARAAADTLATNREIERAYIALTVKKFEVAYETKTGVSGFPLRSGPISMTIIMDLGNHGRTPGQVLGGVFGFAIAPTETPPVTPDITAAIRFSVLFILPGPENKIDFGMSDILKDETNLIDLVRGKTDQRL